MSTKQEQWAVQIREVLAVFRMALLSDEHAIRHRPAAGEWSAVEVVGHMIDKMQFWTGQVERLMVEERPALSGYAGSVNYHGISCNRHFLSLGGSRCEAEV
jgi:hypothetical protein